MRHLLATLTLVFAATPTLTRAEGSSVRCLDVRGAQRDDLAISSDGRFLTWMERNPETGLEDFYSWELESGKVVRRSQGATQARLVEGVVVALDSVPSESRTPRALRFDGQARSQPGHEVLSFVADPARRVVYFTQRNPQTRAQTVWVAPLSGGEPKPLTDWGQAVGVTPDGSALIMWTHNAKGEVVKLPLDGSPATVLAAHVGTTYVVGDSMLFNPSVGDNVGPLQVVGFDGSPPRTLPPDFRSSIGAVRGAHTFQSWNRDAPLTTLTRFDGKDLRPIARLAGARTAGSVVLPRKEEANEHMAMLLIHDTTGDGRVDHHDEADVCLAVVSETAIHQVALRNHPKRFSGLAAKAGLLLKGEFEGATLRFMELDNKTTLVIEVDAEGPVELPMKFGQLAVPAALLKELTTLSNREDPSQSPAPPNLLVRWLKNERHATMTFYPKEGMAIPTSGAHGMSTMPREVFDVALSPTIKTQTNFEWSEPYRYRCEGTIENLGKARIDATIVCSSRPGGPVSLSASTVVKELDPGEIRRFSIELGAAKVPVSNTTTKVTIDGKDALWFNDYALAEARDLAAVADRIRAATGWSLSVGSDLGRYMKLSVEHEAPRLIAPGFSQRTKAEQERIVRLLWKELSAHYRDHHDKATFSIAIDDGTEKGRIIRDGRLVKE